jgi:hypothetical protein
MEDFNTNLRRVLADRHSPEATALFRTLLGYIGRRVTAVANGRCRGLLSESDIEEIAGEVLFQLMQGGLARFRGESMPELIGFVRTMCDRTTWRAAQRRARERDAVAEFRNTDDDAWTPSAIRSDVVEFEARSPLSEADQTYLAELISAGSKAELARRAGVSRAAVTQRIRRIQDRIAQLAPRDRGAHDAWMKQTAHDVLESRASGLQG